jgi:hypothetical protein
MSSDPKINMAQTAEVKQYLAYWFQLGKKIIISSLNQSVIPKKIFNGHGYSAEFEDLWTLVSGAPYAGEAYLEGTNQTISQLLSPQWEIMDCARCNMPVPIVQSGVQKNYCCVCSDLDGWPNSELPNPRSPVNNQQRLTRIQSSLNRKNELENNKTHNK